MEVAGWRWTRSLGEGGEGGAILNLLSIFSQEDAVEGRGGVTLRWTWWPRCLGVLEGSGGVLEWMWSACGRCG